MAVCFRSAKSGSIYDGFAPEMSKICDNTANLTISRGPQNRKNQMCCKNDKNNNSKQEQEPEQQQQQQQQQEEEQEQSRKCDKKMCGKIVSSCGRERTSYYALHLRARAEHMNNTNAHTTIQNPYGIAGVRSSKYFKFKSSLDSLFHLEKWYFETLRTTNTRS